MKLLKKPKFPLLVDIAEGKHFGRFIETFKDYGQKPGTINIKYHPTGFGGTFKTLTAKNIPEKGGLVRIGKDKNPELSEESIYYIIIGENGESPIYGNHMKEDSTQTIKNLQERISVLQTQLAAIHKSEKIASMGVHEKLMEHEETEKIIKPKRRSVPTPYSRFTQPTPVDEEEEL